MGAMEAISVCPSFLWSELRAYGNLRRSGDLNNIPYRGFRSYMKWLTAWKTGRNITNNIHLHKYAISEDAAEFRL